MRIFAGLLLSLFLISCGVSANVTFPYRAFEDLKETDVIDRGATLCGDQPVPAFALHVGGKSWWMLWVTAKGWILVYFGDGPEPPEGARSNTIYYGRWQQEGDRHLFQLHHQGNDPGPERSESVFCGWLLGADA